MTEWPGVVDPSLLKPELVSDANRLADAARSGAWDSVLSLLESSPWLGPNRWRVDGSSWFTALHQAAWHGAPVAVVERLVAMGAWRSLRTAAGDRAVDIARDRGHAHLVAALETTRDGTRDRRRYEAWDRHLTELIASRTASLEPVRYRPVPTEVVEVEGLETLWFPYPGMYGGFSISVHRSRLFVESWSRVAGGSGQAHVITEDHCVLVDEGFV
ncbi:UNVERIFIED_CONTAM: ankyrin [Mumia flava]